MENIAKDCDRCHLANYRTNVVWGRGNPSGRVMIIGEAPGAREDALGQPFVGRAGKLLDTMLEEAGLTNECYITNVVKCRPPNNRTPTKGEVSCCVGYLSHQIVETNIHVLVLLGATAMRTILGDGHAIAKARGIWHHAPPLWIMATFHPAYLLRNPADKELVANDFASVLEKIKSLEMG